MEEINLMAVKVKNKDYKLNLVKDLVVNTVVLIYVNNVQYIINHC
jgi:hypothetical protein